MWSPVANEDGKYSSGILCILPFVLQLSVEETRYVVGPGIMFRVQAEAATPEADPRGHWAVNEGYSEVLATCDQESGTNYAYSSEDCYRRPDGSGCLGKWTRHFFWDYLDDIDEKIVVTAVEEVSDEDDEDDAHKVAKDVLPAWLQVLIESHLLELLIITVPIVCSACVGAVSCITRHTDCGKTAKRHITLKMSTCCGGSDTDIESEGAKQSHEAGHVALARNSVEDSSVTGEVRP